MENIRELDKRHLWHPFTQFSEWQNEDMVIIAGGEGNYLIDESGRKYLDGVSSLWVNLFGHRHPKITAAIKRQADTIAHSTFLGLTHEGAVRLAKMLIDIAPDNLTRVFYSDNGATAVEIALKMALQYWQQEGSEAGKHKTQFISFHGAYHGDTIGAVAVGGIDIYHKLFRPMFVPGIKIDFPNEYRYLLTQKKLKSPGEFIEEMERAVAEHHATLAAFIVEPLIQGANGMVTMPQGFLKRLEEICRKYDVLMIADEVATGFGRTGKMFACGHENVKPDLLCLAKGITGGYLPLAATLATKRIFEAFTAPYEEFKAFYHGHSYTANPLGCAAAIATLGIFREENVLENLQPKIRHLALNLEPFMTFQHVGDVRQCGLMAGIELVKNRNNNEPCLPAERVGHKIIMRAREQGVILRSLGNVIVLLPPLSISSSEIDLLTDAAFRSIREVTGG